MKVAEDNWTVKEEKRRVMEKSHANLSNLHSNATFALSPS